MSTALTPQQLKQQAAEAALDLLPENEIIGIGTGSTVNCLIDLLPKKNIRQVISSSQASTARLQALGIEVLDPNSVGPTGFYVDGADEINGQMHMLKGGGGALTREKILASMAQTFICLADESKLVRWLGNFPLAVEVIPLARSAVAREISALGGSPVYRSGFVTDNGNQIIDIYDLDFNQAEELDQTLNAIPGIVEHGLFRRQKANIACIAGADGVTVYRDIIPGLL